MAGPKASRPHMPGYALAAENEGRGLLPFSWAVERLEANRNYWVSTTRPDGRPHCMALWGVWLDDVFYFDTDPNSRKARNLAKRSECVVTTESAAEAVIVEGTAQRVDDADVIRSAKAVYQKKYAQPAPPPGALFAVRPRVVFAFIEREDQFQGSATRWTF